MKRHAKSKSCKLVAVMVHHAALPPEDTHAGGRKTTLETQSHSKTMILNTTRARSQAGIKDVSSSPFHIWTCTCIYIYVYMYHMTRAEDVTPDVQRSRSFHPETTVGNMHNKLHSKLCRLVHVFKKLHTYPPVQERKAEVTSI